VRFVVGDTDLSTGDGLMVVRILAAMAANESATKSRRVKRKIEQNAAAGLPHGGWVRAFGFAEDKMTVIESQAAVIRQVAERFLAGESLRSLATWLEDNEISYRDRQAVADCDPGHHVEVRPDRRAARTQRGNRRAGGLAGDLHRGAAPAHPGTDGRRR
jgi:hypothetical protein